MKGNSGNTEFGISVSFQSKIPLKTNSDKLITGAFSEKDNFSNLKKSDKTNLNIHEDYTKKEENDLTIFTKSHRHNQIVSLTEIDNMNLNENSMHLNPL